MTRTTVREALDATDGDTDTVLLWLRSKPVYAKDRTNPMRVRRAKLMYDDSVVRIYEVDTGDVFVYDTNEISFDFDVWELLQG